MNANPKVLTIENLAHGQILSQVNEGIKEMYEHLQAHPDITTPRRHVALKVGMYCDDAGEVCLGVDVKLFLPGPSAKQKWSRIASGITKNRNQLVFKFEDDPEMSQTA